jgi:hypothetical protein
MVDNFDRGHFPYNTLGWCLISWDFSHMGSAYPYSWRMHVTFRKAWSRNSIKLYMRNMCLEFIWLGASVLRLGRGLSQYWAKTTMWFGPEMFLIITSTIHFPACIKTSIIHWHFLLCQCFTALDMNWLEPEYIGPTWRGRSESLWHNTGSQWIVVARPLCHLQCPVTYLSPLQRIQLVAHSEGSFKADHDGSSAR